MTEYRDVSGWPLYRVGDNGSVESGKNTQGHPTGRWTPLRMSPNPKGYPVVTLCDHGRSRKVKVHVLILETFVGPCPYGLECLHGDRNPLNNTLSNLRWGTHKENSDDSARHGTMITGSKHVWSKLESRDIPIICRLDALGVPQRIIADAFNVSQQCVSLVVLNKTYKNESRG